MDKPVEHYWKIRLAHVQKMLEENNFEVHVAADRYEAKKIALQEIIPKTGAKSISWGGSMTFMASGLYDALKDSKDFQVLDAYDKSLTPEQMIERRRQALLVDLFITGTNAVTEDGQLVNLDMIGNRVGAITFGPKQVIILVGRNKIVPDLEAAMFRIKDFAAPTNAMRLDKKTPCVKTGQCMDCKSPERICVSWAITEKAFPKGRIKVILINEDLGF